MTMIANEEGAVDTVDLPGEITDRSCAEAGLAGAEWAPGAIPPGDSAGPLMDDMGFDSATAPGPEFRTVAL